MDIIAYRHLPAESDIRFITNINITCPACGIQSVLRINDPLQLPTFWMIADLFLCEGKVFIIFHFLLQKSFFLPSYFLYLLDIHPRGIFWICPGYSSSITMCDPSADWNRNEHNRWLPMHHLAEGSKAFFDIIFAKHLTFVQICVCVFSCQTNRSITRSATSNFTLTAVIVVQLCVSLGHNNRHAFNGHSNRWPPLSLLCRFGYCRPLLRGKYRQYPPKRLVELLMLLYVITLAAAENWANSNRFADDERGIRIFSNDCSILDIKNKIVT